MRVLFLFVLLSSLTFAQANDADVSNRLHKNSISFNLGTVIFANGIGAKYQRLFPYENFHVTTTIGADISRLELFGIDDFFVPSLQFGLITGKSKRHHFEFNGGIGWLYMQTPKSGFGPFTSTSFMSSPSTEKSFFIPVGNLAYRFQAPNKGFVFRTGLGFPELLYVGIGVVF